MKICFLGVNDFANTCNRNSRAINRAGTDLHSRCVTRFSHPFGYPEDVVLDRGESSVREALIAVAGADVLVTTGDGDYAGFDEMRRDFGGMRKPVYPMHIGSAYRRSPEAFDAEDRARGWRRRFVSPDLYRFVKDDPEARIHFIPHDEMARHPKERDGDLLRVLHAPSNPDLKRTAEVECGFRSAYSVDPRVRCATVTGRPAPEAWKAMREGADVFVDHLWDWYGGIGGAAQEAMSYGLVLLSDLRMICPETSRFMEPVPGITVKDGAGVQANLCALARDPLAVLELQNASLGWAERHLSPKAIAAYWKENLA